MDQNVMADDARAGKQSTSTVKTFRRFITYGMAALLVSGNVARASTALPNILYFGNSFTGSYFPKDVPALVQDIHTAAGNSTGTVFRRISSGYSLHAHLQSTGTESVEYLATQVLPAGETWDYVVLQGNSIEATTAMGNPTNFVANGKSIIDIIRRSNLSAKAVLFETWARNENIAGFYPTPFANPAAMQTQISASYRQLHQTLLNTNGAGSARYAGVGDAFGVLNWPTSIYANEFYHANNRGELLIALTIYGSLQGPTAVALAQSGLLDSIATSIGLTAADVMPLALAADAAGAPRGDTDLDWDVDFDDLLTLAQNYGRVSSEETQTNWFVGDFDMSGSIDFDDLLSLAQQYSSTVSIEDLSTLGGSAFTSDWQLAVSMVPEPATASIMIVTFARRSRRHR